MAAFGFVSSLAPIVKMLRSAARSGEMPSNTEQYMSFRN